MSPKINNEILLQGVNQVETALGALAYAGLDARNQDKFSRILQAHHLFPDIYAKDNTLVVRTGGHQAEPLRQNLLAACNMVINSAELPPRQIKAAQDLHYELYLQAPLSPVIPLQPGAPAAEQITEYRIAS